MVSKYIQYFLNENNLELGDKGEGIIHAETLFNKNDIQFLLLKKAGKYYKSYFEAEKHLKEDYEYLAGE